MCQIERRSGENLPGVVPFVPPPPVQAFVQESRIAQKIGWHMAYGPVDAATVQSQPQPGLGEGLVVLVDAAYGAARGLEFTFPQQAVEAGPVVLAGPALVMAGDEGTFLAVVEITRNPGAADDSGSFRPPALAEQGLAIAHQPLGSDRRMGGEPGQHQCVGGGVGHGFLGAAGESAQLRPVGMGLDESGDFLETVRSLTPEVEPLDQGPQQRITRLRGLAVCRLPALAVDILEDGPRGFESFGTEGFEAGRRFECRDRGGGSSRRVVLRHGRNEGKHDHQKKGRANTDRAFSPYGFPRDLLYDPPHDLRAPRHWRPVRRCSRMCRGGVVGVLFYPRSGVICIPFLGESHPSGACGGGNVGLCSRQTLF